MQQGRMLQSVWNPFDNERKMKLLMLPQKSTEHGRKDVAIIQN